MLSDSLCSFILVVQAQRQKVPSALQCLPPKFRSNLTNPYLLTAHLLYYSSFACTIKERRSLHSEQLLPDSTRTSVETARQEKAANSDVKFELPELAEASIALS